VTAIGVAACSIIVDIGAGAHAVIAGANDKRELAALALDVCPERLFGLLSLKLLTPKTTTLGPIFLLIG
jgi:hypothetical protein